MVKVWPRRGPIHDVICPLAMTAGLILFLLVVVFWRYVSLGSLSAAAAMPLLIYFLWAPGHAPPLVITLGTLFSAALLFSHPRVDILQHLRRTRKSAACRRFIFAYEPSRISEVPVADRTGVVAGRCAGARRAGSEQASSRRPPKATRGSPLPAEARPAHQGRFPPVAGTPLGVQFVDVAKEAGLTLRPKTSGRNCGGFFGMTIVERPLA